MGGGNHRSCVVCGIKEQRRGEDPLLFARFPLDENRCREWLRVVGNEELVHIPIEKLHKLRYVCGNHFSQRDFNKKHNRLKRHAVPKLNLTSIGLSEDQLAEFPLHVASSSQARKNYGVQISDDPKINKTVIMETENISVPVTKATTSWHREHISLQQPSDSSLNKIIANVTLETNNVPATTGTTSWQKEHNYATLLSQDSCLNKENIADVTLETNNEPAAEGTTRWQKEHNYARQLSQEHFQFVRSPLPEENKENQHGKRKAEDSLVFTPRKRKLIKDLKKTKCMLNSLKKSAKIIENLDSDVLKEFVMAAFRNQHRKPQGRRWTPKNKMSALAILKRSPRTYRYMAHTMPLPSVKTLQNLMKKVPMDTGINQSVLAHLTKISPKKRKNDKLCGLLFDEIALKGRLQFDPAADKVEGFEDFGRENRTNNLADHALVFMLQGIWARFKMPLAYYFVKGTISSAKLAEIIKSVVSAVESTGFHVVTTVCDQGPTNLGAMNILKGNNNTDQNNYFMCNTQKVYMIFDVPHLFKSIRNNFYNNGELVLGDKKAKWIHLVKMEELNRNFLYLHKIKKNCISLKYRAKMKVKFAAQLFSTQASAVLKMMAKAERDAEVADQIMESATIVRDLDRLFDYTNGPSGPKDIKKGFRENVSLTTDHLNVWTDYRKKLHTLKFINADGEKAKNVKCIQGYITTLSTLQDLWNYLKSQGFKYLNLRQLNQDALENLFGVIRQHSPTNKNPTCTNFVAALKTSIISRLTAPHSRGSNCEEDLQELLTDFHDLLFAEETLENYANVEKTFNAIQTEAETYFDYAPVLSIPDEAEFYDIECNLADLEQQPIVYVSGYIAANVLKGRTCLICEQCLKIEDPKENPTYSYIKLREWWENKKSLTYPTIELCRLIETAVKVFKDEVVPYLYYLNICKLTVTLFYTKCDASFFKCSEHRKYILDILYYRLGCLLIRRQCERRNQELSLKEDALADACKRAQQCGAAK